MNLRQRIYFTLVGLRGQALGAAYARYLREDREGIPSETTRSLIARLLAHCERSVPYYAGLMRDRGGDYSRDPEGYLRGLPILTKAIIHARFDDLKAADLDRRRWYVNSSSGSTGEPVNLIQDYGYAARAGAVKLLFARLAGREVGEPEILLWGSIRDITEGTQGWRTHLTNWLTNTTFLNAFYLTPERMRGYIATINARRPKLVFGYAESVYELARFAEQERLPVTPTPAVMTSAGMLHAFMRAAIERVFGCRAYNKYGSREVGDVACERPGLDGLWVAPWGNYLEIVDEDGERVPDGVEGEILVTSLTNYAMPLVRYRIGDRGVLAPAGAGGRGGQVLAALLGRTSDSILTPEGNLVYGGYLWGLLYFKGWVAKCQIVQKDLAHVVYRIVPADGGDHRAELEEVAAQARRALGAGCEVSFEFVDAIPTSPSGKLRYIISEINALGVGDEGLHDMAHPAQGGPDTGQTAWVDPAG